MVIYDCGRYKYVDYVHSGNEEGKHDCNFAARTNQDNNFHY
jgi:hypothetical protein